MNVNDVIAKLKVMLSTQEVVEKVETKMEEAVLVDGTKVMVEGDLAPGNILLVEGPEGAEPLMAPEGLHETTDGKLITVGSNGEIVSVEEKAAEAPAEEVAMEEEVTVEVPEEAAPEVEAIVEAIAELIQPQTEVIEELKKELDMLKERFNKVAGEPAAKPVRNTFSENKAIRDEMFAKRMDALAAIRKSK